MLVAGVQLTGGNPDAKRLYDDLLSNYNRLIRPVANNTDKVTVKMGLKLSQLVDLVSIKECFFLYVLLLKCGQRSDRKKRSATHRLCDSRL